MLRAEAGELKSHVQVVMLVGTVGYQLNQMNVSGIVGEHTVNIWLGAFEWHFEMWRVYLSEVHQEKYHLEQK